LAIIIAPRLSFLRHVAPEGALALSDAGERLASLLMNDPAQDRLDRGALFKEASTGASRSQLVGRCARASTTQLLAGLV
jgi:hypothetical protein